MFDPNEAGDRSVLSAVRAELAKLPVDIFDGVVARTCLKLAETIDKAGSPQFKSQSVSATSKQLDAFLKELRAIAAETQKTSDPLDEIAKRRGSRRTG